MKKHRGQDEEQYHCYNNRIQFLKLPIEIFLLASDSSQEKVPEPSNRCCLNNSH